MIGIELIGTNQFLELFGDTFIDLKLVNPIFAEDDVIPGSITLPFDVPGGETSPLNAQLLNHPDVVFNLEAPRKYDARLWYDGVPYKKGVLQVKGANPKRISVNFNFGLTTIADDFKKKKIRDIVDNVITISAAAFTKKLRIQLLDFTGPNRTITINGVAFEFQQYGTGPIINGVDYAANASTPDGVNKSFADAINNTVVDPPVLASYASGYFEVQPYNDADKLETPLKVEVDELNYKWSISCDAFESAYNDPILAWLNEFYTATPTGTIAKDALRFPMVINKVYDNGLMQSDVNNYIKTSAGYVLNEPVHADGFHGPANLNSICPMVRWKWVFDQLLEYFGIEGEGDYVGDADFAAALMPNSRTLDVLVPLAGIQEWVACAREFNIKDFVPDMTVPEFLKALQKRFNLAVYFNEKTGKLRIAERDAMMAYQVPEDISALCTPLEDIQPQETTGIRLKTVRDTRNLTSKDDQYETGDDPNIELVSVISGWGENFSIKNSSGVVKYANIARASRLKDEIIPASMIFYSWRVTGGSGPFNYPGASIDGAAGVFAFNGVTGLVARKWNKYLRFLMNRKNLPAEVSYELRHLLALDWEKKVHPMEGLNCFISNVNVRLTMTGIERSKVELWTCDLGG